MLVCANSRALNFMIFHCELYFIEVFIMFYHEVREWTCLSMVVCYLVSRAENVTRNETYLSLLYI